MLYEGGVRVPLIIRWPSTIRPGTICDEPVIGVDFYPTFLEAAGATPAADYPLDGVSLMPLFASQGEAGLDREAIYWHFPGYLQANQRLGTWRTTPAGAIRVGDYKLIEFFETGRLELYNLEEDLSQRHDLAAKMPEPTRQLHDRLTKWRNAIGAPMPKPKPGVSPGVSQR